MSTQQVGLSTRFIDIGEGASPIDKQKLRSYLIDLYSLSGLRPIFATVQTTDATVTTLMTVPLLDTTSYFFQTFVLGKRIGGSSGTAGDSAAYSRRALFFRSGGSATLIGSVQDDGTMESQAAWDCTLAASSNNVLLKVTGALNNTVNWTGIATILQL